MSTAEQDWLLDAVSGDVRGFFAEIGITLPDRQGVEAAIRCFANPQAHNRDDRTPSCSVNLLTGLWCCQACGEHGNPYRAAQLSGCSDSQAALLARRFGLFLALEREQASLPGERDVTKWRRMMRESPLILARLGELKGWTPWAIARLGVGWDGERVVFPIRDSKRKLCGVVRYLPGGTPKSLAAGRRDLFPCPELIHRRHPLFIVEGEPDAVSVWSAGHRAVAVPGAGSWRREWAGRLVGRTVVVLTDADAQGRMLASRIMGDVPSARMVDLEPGRGDGWDVGSMVAEASAEGGLGQVSRVLGRLAA